MTRRALILALLAVLGMWCSAALAHDFGAMLVTLDLRDARVIRGTIRVGPQHLPPDAARGFFSKSTTDVAEARERVRRQIEQGISIARVPSAGDGHTREQSPTSQAPVRLAAPKDQPIPSDGLLQFALETTIPPGISSVAWSCSAPLGRYLFRVTTRDEDEPISQWLNPGEVSDPFSITPSSASLQPRPNVWTTYVALGFTHIIPEGFDHILFILGLFLLSARLKPVLAQATAFTLAHTFTLALAASGVIHPAPRIVEPLIALSIAAVGIENIFVRRYTNRRVGIAFGFGLLHGLGFAGVLSEIGLPQGQFVAALAAFNLGVELGQVAVILIAFLLVGFWFRNRTWYRAGVIIPGSAMISLVALVWTFQRL